MLKKNKRKRKLSIKAIHKLLLKKSLLKTKRVKAIRRKERTRLYEILKMRVDKEGNFYSDKELKSLYKKINPLLSNKIISRDYYNKVGIDKDKYAIINFKKKLVKIIDYEHRDKTKRQRRYHGKWIKINRYYKIIKMKEYWERVRALSQYLNIDITSARVYEKKRLSKVRQLKKRFKKVKIKLRRTSDKAIREKLKDMLDEIGKELKQYGEIGTSP